MVWKLLRKNISAVQIAGYALASFIGLAIVISAVKLYGDVKSVFEDKDSFISKDYIIISKRIPTVGAMGLGSGTSFTPAEIADLTKQPWAREVGAFKAADFHVNASLNFGNRGMSTQLFFEAIPDKFFDIESDRWTFAPPSENADADDVFNQVEIPVIISRDYLALYNFGFAAGRGLPQINEEVVSRVPLTFYLSGNGRHDVFRGRIVGFSSRINTIAVPMEFMDWANGRYSSTVESNPSRLIIEANTPGDPEINRYMEAHSYDIAGDKADNGRASYFLNVATTIVVAVGAIITLLAFFIIMLSIYLLLQKNKKILHNLMLLGYSPAQVSRYYYRLICIVNAAVLVLAVAAMILASRYWVGEFGSIGIQSGSPWPAVATGVVISTLVTLFNCLAVRRIVHGNFFNT